MLCHPHQILITPLPRLRLSPLWGAQGTRKGLGCTAAQCSPRQFPLRQEKRCAAAGIAKPSPVLCLSLVFASVTRVQE